MFLTGDGAACPCSFIAFFASFTASFHSATASWYSAYFLLFLYVSKAFAYFAFAFSFLASYFAFAEASMFCHNSETFFATGPKSVVPSSACTFGRMSLLKNIKADIARFGAFLSFGFFATFFAFFAAWNSAYLRVFL